MTGEAGVGPRPSGKAIATGAREARLRPEYAGEYPGMAPGIWIPATELAKKLIERAHTRRKEGRYTRTFDPTHFEFRGGPIKPRSRTSRTRSTDSAEMARNDLEHPAPEAR